MALLFFDKVWNGGVKSWSIGVLPFTYSFNRHLGRERERRMSHSPAFAWEARSDVTAWQAGMLGGVRLHVGVKIKPGLNQVRVSPS